MFELIGGGGYVYIWLPVSVGPSLGDSGFIVHCITNRPLELIIIDVHVADDQLMIQRVFERNLFSSNPQIRTLALWSHLGYILTNSFSNYWQTLDWSIQTLSLFQWSCLACSLHCATKHPLKIAQWNRPLSIYPGGCCRRLHVRVPSATLAVVGKGIDNSYLPIKSSSN
jgi:hypothetical protein